MAALEKARTSALSNPTPKESGDVDVDVDADWENDTVSTSEDVAKAARAPVVTPPKPPTPPKPAAPAPAVEETLDLRRAATLVMEVPAAAAAIPVEPEEEEDEEDADRAYVAPRAVPVAAMPAKEHEELRVVLNIPSSKMDEEVTQAIDKDALDRMRAKERARRREPTVRIPRQEIEAVRAALDAAEAANTGVEIAPMFGAPPAPAFSDLPSSPPIQTARSPKSDPPLAPTMTDASEAIGADVTTPSGPPKSGRLTMALVAMLCVGAISGVTYFVTQMRPSTPQVSNAAPVEPAATTKPVKVEPPPPPVATEVVVPQDPMPVTSVGDPSAVELDKATASTPTPTPSPQPQAQNPRPRPTSTPQTASPRPQPKPVVTPTVSTGKYVPQGI